MKKFLSLPIALLTTSVLLSQGVYNNGGKIAIGPGVTFYIDGSGGNLRNETNISNGNIDLSGTLILHGDLVNNVASADIFSNVAPGSEVLFTGTTAQSAGGSTTSSYTFENLTINNINGITINQDAVVKGIMNLANGVVEIGNNNFSFGPVASVTGTPSVSIMIIATGTGVVQKEWSATGSFTYPVGDNTNTAEYSPVTLNFTSGTFAPGAISSINLVNDKYNNPSVTGSYLNRYWNISQVGITGFSCDAQFQYALADVVGSENNIYSLRVNPPPVTSYDPANTSLHLLTANGLTSFGTYTGGIGFWALSLKLYLEGLYAGSGLMSQAQGDAGNQFPGTTSDRITVELHDPASYGTTVFSAPDIEISTTGLASVNIPSTLSGAYYVTIKQRNSLETVSASPILFSSPIVNYDFSTGLSQAFGNNLRDLGSGVSGIFGGDLNHDGIIDLMDLILAGNQAIVAGSGYIPEDINGDGLVDLTDIIIIGNNAAQAIGIITP
jgi:hypothetical protein